MTSKSDFQQLSEMHSSDASLLQHHGRHTNALHLSGIAIECALKALICDHFLEGVLPDKRVVDNTYKHDLVLLVGLAGIKSVWNDKRKEDADFDVKWSIVLNWSVATRYDIVSRAEAQEMLDAALGEEGVLEWIKTFW